MPILNAGNVRNARKHLATMAGVLKQVASGDTDSAIQTLEDLVSTEDQGQFEELLDSQDTLAHLISIASEAVEDEDEDEYDEDEDGDEDEYDEDEEDEDEEDEDLSATASVKLSSASVMNKRATYLGLALAGFEEEEEDDEDDEDEDEYEEEEEDLDDEDLDDEDDEDQDDDESEDAVTASFREKLGARKLANASVRSPSTVKARSDGRL
jgi:hypothetical protein